MSEVAVVTDSTSYLAPGVAEQHGVTVVPLYVVFGGDRTVPETEITDYGVLRRAALGRDLPTTSQPSVGDFRAAYEPLLATGARSSRSTSPAACPGHPEAARQAKEALEREGKGGERIQVIDSTTAAGGLGFLVLAAVGPRARAWPGGRRARDRRAQGAEDVVRDRHARVPAPRRRIGAASAWIGSTLKVKPILTVENEMTPVERVRTSGRAFFERMVDYGRQRRDSARTPGASSTSTRPTRPPSWSSACASCSARADDRQRDRPRARRTPVPGCSAPAACRSTSCASRLHGRPARIAP